MVQGLKFEFHEYLLIEYLIYRNILRYELLIYNVKLATWVNVDFTTEWL